MTKVHKADRYGRKYWKSLKAHYEVQQIYYNSIYQILKQISITYVAQENISYTYGGWNFNNNSTCKFKLTRNGWSFRKNEIAKSTRESEM